MSTSDKHTLADEELMLLVERRDGGAFEVLYDRHAGAAYSLAYRILGNQTQAEDVTQEAFLSIWRHGTSFDRARGSVRAWLLGVLRNRAIDVIRSQAGRAPTLNVDLDEVQQPIVESELTDTRALRRESARKVRGALGTLPIDQLQVIQLAYFGGLSQTEIAEVVGVPLGTVKGRMRLGIEKMRVQLAEQI